MEHAPTLLDDNPVKMNYLHLHSDAFILHARCKRLEEFDGCFTAYKVTEANGPGTGYRYSIPLRCRYDMSMSSHRMICVVDLIWPIDLTDFCAPHLSDAIEALANQIVRITSD